MRSNVVLPHPEGPSSTRNSPSRIERSTSSTRSEEHTSELQSPCNLVCRLLLEKKKTNTPVYVYSPLLVVTHALRVMYIMLLSALPVTPLLSAIFVLLVLVITALIMLYVCCPSL